MFTELRRQAVEHVLQPLKIHHWKFFFLPTILLAE